MAIKTRRVLRKLGDILECGVALTNLLPVGSRKLVAPLARQLFFCDVSGMRKLSVVYDWLLLHPGCGTPA
jgi:hypothetical protein